MDLAFGAYVQYGQLNKDYRNADRPGRYAPPEMVGSYRHVVVGDFDKISICMSHERNHLTMRTFLRRLKRLSLGFSKKFENHAAALSLHVGHYNFCRRHSTIRMTPAMAAGETNTLWTLQDLLEGVRA